MSYLQTVVSYNQPSEAEVDKAFLESEGIAVCLLNANMTRNEIGPSFYIQLQVSAEDFPRAVQLLRAANPQRFGSAETVAQIEKTLVRGLASFFVPALIFGVAGYFLPAAPSEPFAPDARPAAAIAAGALAGILVVLFRRRRRKRA